MAFESLRYRRREFLGICATVPLIADLAAGAEPIIPGGVSLPLVSLDVPKIAEADLAREVEVLLKLVDPPVLYRPVPLTDEKNAWPFWQQAIKAHVEEPHDDEFQHGIEKFVDGRPSLADDVRQRILDLDDLVTDEQLPETPRDPYDGNRFRYSKERRVLWCVGQEGTNRGVVSEQKEPDSLFNADTQVTWRIDG
jgi:hypothetical protein